MLTVHTSHAEPSLERHHAGALVCISRSACTCSLPVLVVPSSRALFCPPRLNEIRVLKIKLADLRRELHVLRTGVANVDVLKREVSTAATLAVLACRTLR